MPALYTFHSPLLGSWWCRKMVSSAWRASFLALLWLLHGSRAAVDIPSLTQLSVFWMRWPRLRLTFLIDLDVCMVQIIDVRLGSMIRGLEKIYSCIRMPNWQDIRSFPCSFLLSFSPSLALPLSVCQFMVQGWSWWIVTAPCLSYLRLRSH